MVLFPLSLGSNNAFNGAGPSTICRSYVAPIAGSTLRLDKQRNIVSDLPRKLSGQIKILCPAVRGEDFFLRNTYMLKEGSRYSSCECLTLQSSGS